MSNSIAFSHTASNTKVSSLRICITDAAQGRHSDQKRKDSAMMAVGMYVFAAWRSIV